MGLVLLTFVGSFTTGKAANLLLPMLISTINLFGTTVVND